MSRVAIFVDGAYFDKVLEHQFSKTRINYDELSRTIAERIHPDMDILRTYYYHCLPYQSDPPTQEEEERFGRMQSFTDTLSRLPRYEVRLGKLAFRGIDAEGNPIFIQKMVDILLGVDLVRLSTKAAITHAALVAGDSDFVPAVQVARDEGVAVWLFHGERPHHKLWEMADERVKFDESFIDAIRRTT